MAPSGRGSWDPPNSGGRHRAASRRVKLRKHGANFDLCCRVVLEFSKWAAGDLAGKAQVCKLSYRLPRRSGSVMLRATCREAAQKWWTRIDYVYVSSIHRKKLWNKLDIIYHRQAWHTRGGPSGENRFNYSHSTIAPIFVRGTNNERARAFVGTLQFYAYWSLSSRVEMKLPSPEPKTSSSPWIRTWIRSGVLLRRGEVNLPWKRLT